MAVSTKWLNKLLSSELKAVYIDTSRAQAGVAQLVEQRFRKPQVAGSIPVAGSTLFHGISGSCTVTPVCGFRG